MIAAEEIVLASEGERPDGVFDAVVVDVVTAVQDVSKPAEECTTPGISKVLRPGGAGFGVEPRY